MATPPKAQPHKATLITPKSMILTPASPLACLASYSAGPVNLGITHPIPLIGPAALSAAPASLGITYPEPITHLSPSNSSLLDKYFPKSSTITPIPSEIATTPPPSSHDLLEDCLLDLSTHDTLITEEELKDPQVTCNIILYNINNNSLCITPNPRRLNRGALIKAYLIAASESLQPPRSKWIDVCKKCKDSVLLCMCYDHSYDHPPPSPTLSLLL